MNCDTSYSIKSMFEQVGKRLINPWWLISADGTLYNRAPGHIVFNQVIRLPFYAAHDDWSVEHEVTPDGEVLHFKAVNRLELRCQAYEYHAACNAAFSVEEPPYIAPVEPALARAVLRDTGAGDCIGIECTMLDGQKGAFIQVDADFPGLAAKVVELLSADLAKSIVPDGRGGFYAHRDYMAKVRA